jgi:hypothetical protein
MMAPGRLMIIYTKGSVVEFALISGLNKTNQSAPLSLIEVAATASIFINKS